MKTKAPKVGADEFAAAGHGEADLDALPREGLAYTLERHGDEFLVSWPEHKVECALTAIHENGEGIHAELSVSHGGVDVHWGRLGLASTQSREAVVRKLSSMLAKVPWRALLEATCRSTAQALRRSSVTVTLHGQRATGPRYLVDPLLPLHQPTVLIADGGSGKGYLSVALALAVGDGAPLPSNLHAAIRCPVLYLDWESDAEDLDDRVYVVSRGLGLGCVAGLHYRRMVRPLVDEAPALRAEVSRLGIGFLIVDSLAPASGPEPESADAAIRTHNAIRSLGTLSSLCLAHLSKAAADQRGPARPFGSVFIQNLARSVWEMRRDGESEDLLAGLYHRKVNRGRLCSPLALRFHFTEQAVSLTRADIQEAPELAARTTVGQQVLAALRPGAKTIPRLAEELDLGHDTVRRTLQRLAQRDKVVRLSEGHGGKGQEIPWGLRT